MTAMNLLPGRRSFIWLLAMVVTTLLAACKTEEKPAPASAETALTVSAEDVAIVRLPASMLPAGATVTWSVDSAPVDLRAFRLIYAWNEREIQLWAPVQGTYYLTAAVSHAGHVLRKPVVVTATPFGGITLPVKVGDSNTIAMPADAVPAGTTSFDWYVRQKPEEATYTLTPGPVSFDFNSATEGTYQVTAIMQVGDVVRYRILHLVASAYAKLRQLDFNVADAGYSRSQDLLVLLDRDQPLVHFYSLSTDTFSTVTLPHQGYALSVSANGLRAAVGEAGYVSHIDLATRAVTSTLAAGIKVTSIAVNDSGLALAAASPATEDITPHSGFGRTIDFVAGTVKSSEALPSPGTGSLWGATNSLVEGSRIQTGGGRWYSQHGPANIERFGFESGIARTDYSKDGGAEHPFSSKFWLLEGGDKLITSNGNVYSTSDAYADDLTPVGQLTNLGSVSYLPFMKEFDHSLAASRILVVPLAPMSVDGDTRVVSFATDGAVDRVIPMPGVTVAGVSYVARANWAFFSGDGTNHVAVIRALDTSEQRTSTLANAWFIAVRN